jgi:sorbitol/mannitol transport system substrate-binding protein
VPLPSRLRPAAVRARPGARPCAPSGGRRPILLSLSLTLLAVLLAGSAPAVAQERPRPTDRARPPVDVVVATVNNAHMIELQRQSAQFEQANPDIRLRWLTLEESTLRQRVASAVLRGGAQYDVVTIGLYETQVWGRQGWLQALKPPPAWDEADLLPAIRQGLSIDGRLHALPFYGESSMLMYRKDLAERHNVRLPERPTWRQVADAASRMHDPSEGVHGICLRGKPGWGDNMALILTMVNAHGGQWFDMGWRPQVDSPPWQAAVGLYVDLMRRYGPPGAEADSYNELLARFRQGQCAIWVDATIAASFLEDPAGSQVAGRVGYTLAPQAVTAKGAGWLWAWTLAVPVGSRQPEAARRFVAWASSRAYVAQVARTRGWAAVPTGTRRSTYRESGFQRAAAAFYAAELRALDAINPDDATVPRSPYQGVQYAAIPEFQTIGIAVGQQIAAALAGRQTVAQALQAAQRLAEQEMRRAGYY